MSGFIVPSKLYTALAYGRPILAVVPEESQVAAIVRRWGCGVVADPEDPADVADKLIDVLAQPEQLAQMASRAREAGRHFERPAVLRPIVSRAETLSSPTRD
jgi:hypothetical protein